MNDFEDESTYTRVDYFELKDNTLVYSMNVNFARNNYYYVNKIVQLVLSKFKEIMKFEEPILIYVINNTHSEQQFINLCEMNGYKLLGFRKNDNNRLYGMLLN